MYVVFLAIGAYVEERGAFGRAEPFMTVARVIGGAEGIEVQGATMDNGLLYIELERIVPEPEVRTIKIESGPSGSKGKSPKTIDVKAD